MKFSTRILLIVIAMLVGMAAPMDSATPKKGKSTTTQTAKSGKSGNSSKNKTANTGKSGKKTQGASKKTKGNSGKNSGKKNSGKNKQESSADLKKQQEATQREIKQTQEQIKANEAAVKKNLNELGKLQGDIDQSKERVNAASRQVQATQGKIEELEGEIAADEASLAQLRAEYLKAVKSVRSKKKSLSILSFIFSSDNFNQALRRLRYLKEFSSWREARSAELKAGVEKLRKQRDELARTKAMHDQALGRETAARNALQQQYSKQDALVVELRKNGQALKNHLAQKQAEANALKNRVAAVIAQEQQRAEAQRKAEEDRRAREEADRVAKAQREKEAAAEKAKQAEQAEQQAKEKGKENKKETKKQDKKQDKKEEKKQEKRKDKKSETKKQAVKEEQKKDVQKSEPAKSETSGNDYADARKRKPRGDAAAQKPAATSDNGFESMCGSLPRPVSGSFKVTSRFGRHSLPDMPDVEFDNPGIDAEVAKGATAQAVYAGKVSGVYMVPGFETVVIVNHGNYYTVYGNIASPSVKVGDSVKQGQAIGRVGAAEDDDSHGSIHFEVWKNRDKQDPMRWIR